VRLAVEQDVAAEYQELGESEEEWKSKLSGRAGLYLIRDMATKLK
jgi:D-tyrosyl-tRNA(Tyr) deacylase